MTPNCPHYQQSCCADKCAYEIGACPGFRCPGREEEKMKSIMIEISFPVPVEFPPGFEQALNSLINMVCQKYETDNPTRSMWPAGNGAKPVWREPEEPDFDPQIYRIDVAEREAHARELERRKARMAAVLRQEGK